MKRKWVYILTAAFLLALAGYGVVRARQRDQAADHNLDTRRVTKGDLEAVIDATGEVYARQSVILSWQTSGEVDQVMIELGDRVREGQQLAGLKKDTLSQSILQAEQELIRAQQDLEDLFDQAALAAAEAQLTLARARETLDDAEHDVYINQPGNRASPEELKSARAKVTINDKRVDEAEKRLDKASGKVARAKAQIALTDAIDGYQTAVWYLNWLQEGATEIEMAILEGELTLAQEKLALAEIEYQEIKAGPRTADIQLAEARVAAAQAALDLITLEAPFDAVVTNINIQPGDLVQVGTMAFRLDDLSQLLIDVEVSEVDINQIQIGQQVNLRFDAVLNNQYQGRVSEISPVGEEQQGLVSFLVTVQLETTDGQVKPGMTAAASVVVQYVEDVVMVPNRAVRWVDGAQVVYILDDPADRESLRMVEVGLGASSDDFSEVQSGEVSEGDLVLLNPPNEPLDFQPGSGEGPPNPFQ